MNTDLMSIDSCMVAEPAAELDRLGEEIAELSAHRDAATARLLDLIREFDARGGWGNGFRSCAAWLSWRVSLAPGAAREKVRVARALGTLPRLAQALARGWRRVDRKAEAQEASRRHAGRALQVYQDEDGMVVVRGRLEPEVGAVLVQALAAAREALYQKAHTENVPAGTCGTVPAETPPVSEWGAPQRTGRALQLERPSASRATRLG